MDWLLAPFRSELMQHAMIAGIVVGAVCALIGVFVVQRGLSFLGDGLAHAAFGGIALGLLIDVDPDHASWVALPFTVAIALAIGFVLRRGSLRGDVATGVFFALSFALGVLFLGLRPASAPTVDVESVLFGRILAISTTNLIVVCAVAAGTLIVLALTWSRLAYASFDPELAELSGVPVAVLDYTLLALTAVVIVVAVRTVGVVLVSSFIVIPAATARMIGRTLAKVGLIALAIGTLGAAVGLVLSYHLDVASGATIILTLGAAFVITLLFFHRRH